MPLQYDDVPGSWRGFSASWPKIVFLTEDEAKRAFIACTKANVVPYGSYVMVGLELRTETLDQRNNLLDWLNDCPEKTYDSLVNRFIKEGKW